MREITFVSKTEGMSLSMDNGKFIKFINHNFKTKNREIVIQLLTSRLYKKEYTVEGVDVLKLVEDLNFNDREKVFPNLSKEVSIIIPTRFNPENLENCLKSVYEHTPKGYELIIIDNEAPEESKKIMAKWEKKIGENMKIIHNAENHSYAASNNQGVEMATRPYICYLNDDTIVGDKWLDSMVHIIKTIDKCGMVGKSSFTKDRKPGDLQQSIYTDRCNVAFGYCEVLRKEDAHFDEDFEFAGWEDIDLCERIKRADKEIWVERCFPIIHLGRSSVGKIENIDKIYAKNRAYFERKWGKSYT